jgi:hypothetical protein
VFKRILSDFLRFLVRLASDSPNERLLSAVRAVARSVGAEAHNPKWTSYGALELDIFSPSKADFALFLAAAHPLARLEFAKDLNAAPLHRPKAELLAEARELFNSERYWECHEVLEGLWRTKKGEEKRLLQGMILVCAAFVHHQKENEDVALSVLKRAASQLENHATSYGGFDVALLRSNVLRMVDERRLWVFRV